MSQVNGGDRAEDNFFPELEQTRQIAADASTDPAVLRKLATNGDRITRQHVAANPNTPIDILLQLGAEFPEQLLENPIFPLLYLENPNADLKIPDNTLKTLLKLENLPVHFLVWGVNSRDSEVLFGLATNPSTPQFALENLLRNCSQIKITEAAQLHVNFSGKMSEGWDEIAIAKMEELIKNDSYFVGCYKKELSFFIPDMFQGLSGDIFLKISHLFCEFFSFNMPVEYLNTLSKDDNTFVRIRVAEHPHVPLYLFEELAKDTSESVRREVATNLNTPVKVLEQLANDEVSIVRARVARNPNTPAKLLERLANDDCNLTREAVASHPQTSKRVLKQLAQDVRDSVLQYVAENINTPVSVLEKLANGNNIVRQGVAQNPNTPIAVLEHLIKDEYLVRARVAKNPQLPLKFLEKLAKDEHESVRSGVAKNPKTPVYWLEKLAQDPQNVVRYGLTLNPKTPVYLLEKLAQDTDSLVKLGLLKNPNIPCYCLEQWANDRDNRVREEVAKHPNTPVRALEQLLGDRRSYSIFRRGGAGKWMYYRIIATQYLTKNPDGLPFVLENFAKYSHSLLERVLVLSHPKIPTCLLTEYSCAFEWLIRYAIAKNPSTPTALLERLAADANRVVRATAKASLQQRQSQLFADTA